MLYQMWFYWWSESTYFLASGTWLLICQILVFSVCVSKDYLKHLPTLLSYLRALSSLQHAIIISFAGTLVVLLVHRMSCCPLHADYTVSGKYPMHGKTHVRQSEERVLKKFRGLPSFKFSRVLVVFQDIPSKVIALLPTTNTETQHLAGFSGLWRQHAPHLGMLFWPIYQVAWKAAIFE